MIWDDFRLSVDWPQNSTGFRQNTSLCELSSGISKASERPDEKEFLVAGMSQLCPACQRSEQAARTLLRTVRTWAVPVGITMHNGEALAELLFAYRCVLNTGTVPLRIPALIR